MNPYKKWQDDGFVPSATAIQNQEARVSEYPWGPLFSNAMDEWRDLCAHRDETEMPNRIPALASRMAADPTQDWT